MYAVFSGHGLQGLGYVGPRQKIVDLALRMAGDDAGDDVGEVGVRFDAVELATLNERGDCRPVLGAAVRAGKERVFTVQGNRPDGAFDDVGVNLDPAVIEEAGQARPA